MPWNNDNVTSLATDVAKKKKRFENAFYQNELEWW